MSKFSINKLETTTDPEKAESEIQPVILKPNETIGFYSHNKNKAYNYMSNFFESPFMVSVEDLKERREWPASISQLERLTNIQFWCSEQYFMLWKAILFYNQNQAVNGKIITNMLEKKYAGNYKDLGRMVEGFQQEVWDEHKYDIMKEACMFKFQQNPDLKEELLETENKLLVEASPYDRIWGIGLRSEDPNFLDMSKWRGKNLLGKVLMDVRDELRIESD